MTDLLDRVKKLLERAGHEATPEEEARSAGVMAARLIWAHSLVVTLPKSPAVADLPHRLRTRWIAPCVWCGHDIPKGELCMWAPRIGVAHLGTCAAEAFGA